ncbi:MAG: histidine phosphatase family protein [Alphaproteobacteria bacterium]|nr:histidine phosphatase family protein [Alphaproteobacteria bacterium]
MRTLLLLRHAKSDWHNDLSDHERPLNKRGVKTAPAVAQYIAKSGLSPDRILCSDAVRARATLALALPEMPPPQPAVEIDSRLYLAAAETILKVIGDHAVDDEHRLMVVGHNPGIHALALTLVGDGDKKALSALAMKFPTAALAVISFKTGNWNDIGPAGGRLESFIVPRDLE